MGAAIRTVLMFIVLSALFAIIGFAIGSYFFGDWILGSLVFLAISIAINGVSYFMSSKIVLWSYGAKLVQPNEAPKLYQAIQKVCLKSDMPLPKLAIVDTPTPNAFATGRNKNNAVVAVTTGILNLLSDDELEGVLAHEMAHVKDKDILVMTIAATIVGAISFASRMLFWSSMGGSGRRDSNPYLLIIVMITVPIAALLIRLAISRSREYKADREGAIAIQRPRSLANALAKLERGNTRNPINRGNPASASLFIVNPFRGAAMLSIFSTHPPIEARIKKLEALAQEKGFVG
jgi:heat shock protein HtpX